MKPKWGWYKAVNCAEIYLERENEYTLAGSIYKGRVTRVLPGMQSAFVDIGLERDAFLYVSDFMELEDSEDLDEVPTNRPGSRSAISAQAPGRSAAERRSICVAPVVAEAQPQEPDSEAGHGEPSRSLRLRRVARQPRRHARTAPPPRTPRRAHAGIEVRQPGDRSAARGSARRTSGTQRPSRTQRTARTTGTFGPRRTIRTAERGRSGPNVPNTDRRRDTSPSFCRENPSPNISEWHQSRPAPSQRTACGLRLKSRRRRPIAEVFCRR